jgi:hypothetical protein
MKKLAELSHIRSKIPTLATPPLADAHTEPDYDNFGNLLLHVSLYEAYVQGMYISVHSTTVVR